VRISSIFLLRRQIRAGTHTLQGEHVDGHEQMTFEHYLSLLPPDIVFKKFLVGLDHKRRILSSSYLSEIARQAGHEKPLRDRFRRLSPEARVTCSLVYLYGRRGYTVHGLKGFEDELLSSFLVYAGRDEAGAVRYFGFDEFERRLLPCVTAEIIDKTKTAAPRASAPFNRFRSLYDVTMLAVLASDGMLAKTKKGTFSKLSESVMKKFLHALREPLFRSEEAGGVTSLVMTLLFDYVVSRGLLLVKDLAFLPVAGHILAWLKVPLTERYSDFCDVAFEHVPLWSSTVLDALFEQPQQNWLSTQQLPEGQRRQAETMVALLHYCGILDVQKSGGHLIFSKAPQSTVQDALLAQNSARTVVILPDFSAVLGQEIEPQDLYWFSRVGTLQSFDRVFKGMIRRETINNSLSEGFSGAQCVEWLTGWRAPDNVVSTVKEWIREFSRIYFTTDAAIVSFEEKATRQILSYQPLRRLVEPVRADCVFRIRNGHENEVRRILTGMGFDPRVPAELHEKLPKQEPADLADAPLVVPVVHFEQGEAAVPHTLREGKYSQTLKELDISNMLHVLEYAILMGQAVSFEYAGSSFIRKGPYTVRPQSVHKAPEPSLEGTVLPKGTKKKFLLKSIVKIGVGPS
jgi:hypothetical protein